FIHTELRVLQQELVFTVYKLRVSALTHARLSYITLPYAISITNPTYPSANYPLSLHDALPILDPAGRSCPVPSRGTTVRQRTAGDRKSTRLNSSHVSISYAVFCLKRKSNVH